MPKPSTRNDSTSEAGSVASAEIEGLVQNACQKAVEVLKAELINMFSDRLLHPECNPLNSVAYGYF